MNRLLVVLDTNILVSALLRSLGPSASVLDLVLAGTLRVAYDERILAEWHDVLHRPRFGFPPSDVDSLLTFLQADSLQVTATSAFLLPDPDDAPFLEVAATCGARLITGNLRHYPPDKRHGVIVQEPRAFLDWWNAPL